MQPSTRLRLHGRLSAQISLGASQNSKESDSWRNVDYARHGAKETSGYGIELRVQSKAKKNDIEPVRKQKRKRERLRSAPDLSKSKTVRMRKQGNEKKQRRVDSRRKRRRKRRTRRRGSLGSRRMHGSRPMPNNRKVRS